MTKQHFLVSSGTDTHSQEMQLPVELELLYTHVLCISYNCLIYYSCSKIQRKIWTKQREMSCSCPSSYRRRAHKTAAVGTELQRVQCNSQLSWLADYITLGKLQVLLAQFYLFISVWFNFNARHILLNFFVDNSQIFL